MNVGAENRTKVIILAALVAVAVILLARMLLTVSAQPRQVSAAPAPAGPAAMRVRRGPRATVAAPSLDPELRLGLLQASEGTKYEGRGRNIFVPALEEIPHPMKQDKTPLAQGPPPPPPPPPIPLKFFGFASHVGEPKRIFLAQGDDVFIGGEGEIVDRRYKIVRISPTSVEIEDMLNNNRQSIPLTQS